MPTLKEQILKVHCKQAKVYVLLTTLIRGAAILVYFSSDITFSGTAGAS